MGMNVRISSCFGGYNNYDYYRANSNETNAAEFASEPIVSVDKPKSRADEVMDQIGQKAAATAISQDGIKERSGKNDGKDIDKYRYNNRRFRGASWCGAFYNWSHNPNHAYGENVFGLSDREVLSSQRILRAAKKERCFISAKSGIMPRVGDGIIWTTDESPAHGHIAIVTEVREDGSFVTEHGNNNDAVQRIEYSSIGAAMKRTNSDGQSQTLQGFVEAPKYFARKQLNVEI